MRTRRTLIVLAFVALYMLGCCKCGIPGGKKMDIKKVAFGKTADGKADELRRHRNFTSGPRPQRETRRCGSGV